MNLKDSSVGVFSAVVTFCLGIGITGFYLAKQINDSAVQVEQQEAVPFRNSACYPEIDERYAQEDLPEPSSTPENTSLADKSPQYLCDHILELKHMSFKTEFSGDAIYDALKRKGRDAMPCLIDRITDTRPAENPTGAPFWDGLTYRVGDTAVLMLMDINEMYWPKGMMPEKYERMFKDEGMFSYYFYVDEVSGARKQVQHWWRNWIKTCRPKCETVPTLGK